MALTGLQIQKLLPGTNCRECGSNTCLAFAMKLAGKKIELSACPYASDEAKRVLGAASEPPVRCVGLGGEGKLQIGGETCLYRHEKTFVHQTLFALNINDTDAPELQIAKFQTLAGYRLERVGEELRFELAAVTQRGDAPERFLDLAKRAWADLKFPVVLRTHDVEALCAAAKRLAGSRSVLCPGVDAGCAVPAEMLERAAKAALEHGHALAITAPTLDELAALGAKLKAQGCNDLILQYPAMSPAEALQVNSIARRAALKSNFRPLGYPSLKTMSAGGDLLGACVTAATEVTKYGGICVFEEFDAALMTALLTLRQNIYTDPQKPIQVEPGIYPVGEPKADSPVFVTTNFSLTYFIVSGEIENSGISAWLVVPECEGMSVLTAWAAGKFSGASIAAFCKAAGLEAKVTRRDLVIPGYVAQISGELEELLPGWRVLVGPQEAGDLESFVKNRLAA